MTREERIIELGARAKAAVEALGSAIAEGAPDAEKEVIAKHVNAVADDLAKLRGWHLP